MQRHYGEKVIQELEELDRQNKKWTIPELEDLQVELKKKIAELGG
jgi:hypothetical protein